MSITISQLARNTRMRQGQVNLANRGMLPGTLSVHPYNRTGFRPGFDPVPGRKVPATPGSLKMHILARV